MGGGPQGPGKGKNEEAKENSPTQKKNYTKFKRNGTRKLARTDSLLQAV